MVKLDVSLLRFLEDEDFRVLTALEMAMRNHEVAPTALVERIAQLPQGGVRKRLQHLLKYKIIHHENTMYDGYSMKYLSYDYLALRTLRKRGSCAGVGHRIGCGKESDIILVVDDNDRECVLKLQRLGRCSFRTVTRNRDYKGGFKKRHGESWFYLSRLASQKEYGFMKILYDEGFPVPKPLDQNRHALLMELVPGTLLNHVASLDGKEAKVYKSCLDLMIKLAENGLVHGDFNEFNLMIRNDNAQVVMIDFPQMVSINHRNAADLFARDVANLANFFRRRFNLDTVYYPNLEKDVVRKGDLDRQVYASGYFSQRDDRKLETLMADQNKEYEGDEYDDDNEDEEEEDEEEEDEEDEDPSAQKTTKKTGAAVVPIPWSDKADKHDDRRDPNRNLSHDDDDDDDDVDDDEEGAEEGGGSSQGAEEDEETEEKGRGADVRGADAAAVRGAPNAKRMVPTLVAARAADTADSNHNDNDDDDEEDLDLDTRVARTKERRRVERENAFKTMDKSNNPNYRADGNINEEHIKRQVRKNITRADNQNFNRHLNRNVQKGRKKRSEKARERDAVQDYYASRAD